MSEGEREERGDDEVADTARSAATRAGDDADTRNEASSTTI